MRSESSATDSSPGASLALPRFFKSLGWILGRSLFPFVALVLILGTILWGPWVTLVLTIVSAVQYIYRARGILFAA